MPRGCILDLGPPGAGSRAAERRPLRARPALSLRVGWVERVALPGLGLVALPAKVDTGARTSALHVAALALPASSAQSGLQLLEVVLPGPGNRSERIVRVSVVGWVEVRDTSGRRERRPVIETPLEMGPIRRTIRLTLTHRGDMRYPMLVGRTALPAGTLVDPQARFLLRPNLTGQVAPDVAHALVGGRNRRKI